MEALLVKEGGLTPDQALMVAGLAKASNLLFGCTADFQVAREFAAAATDDEKLALVRCLFAVASVDAAISVAEESEIHRIANHFKIHPHDLTACGWPMRHSSQGLPRIARPPDSGPWGLEHRRRDDHPSGGTRSRHTSPASRNRPY